MYCTLQEAYNIPSFVSKKKKSCMNPLSTQMDNKQSPPIGKISADNYDPYDTYTAENGKEHALAIELAKNAGVNNPNTIIMSNGMSSPSKKTIEGFSGENGLTMYNTMTTEIPYKAQTKDYKYYCDAFNICPDPVIEGFNGSSSSQSNANDSPYQQWQQQLQQSSSIIPQLLQYSQQMQTNNAGQNKPWQRPQAQYKLSPSIQTQMQSQPKQLVEKFESPTISSSPISSASISSAPISSAPISSAPIFQNIPQGYDQQGPSPALINLPYYGSNPLGKCGPLQSPPYILPVNDSNVAQFQQAMNVAVDQTGSQSSDINGPYPLRRVDMSKVGAYYDEELEKFLTTQSMQSEELPPPLKETPVDVNKYDSIYPLRPLYQQTENPSIEQSKPPASVSNLFSQPPSPSNPNYLQSSQYILDILLFIGGGIIIILLCDQIFRLGMSYGMRDTVKVLMPYLQDIQQNIKLENI